MIVSGTILWGATGTMMEWVLTNSDLTVSFMLTNRLFFAGLSLFFAYNKNNDITSIWKHSV